MNNTANTTETTSNDVKSVNTDQIAVDTTFNETNSMDTDTPSTPNSDPGKSPKNQNYHFESNRKYFSISIYALFVIAIGTFLIYSIINMNQTKSAIKGLVNALSPFLIAFFIAYILNPIVVKIRSFLENRCKVKSRKVSKALSIIFTYLIVISIITITMVYIIPELGKSLTELSSKFQTIGNWVIDLLQNIENRYPDIDFSFFEDKISDMAMQLVTLGPNMVSDLIPAIFNFSISIVKLAINLLLSVVISVYMLNDKKMIQYNVKRALYAFFPKHKVDSFIDTSKNCNAIFSNFIVGKSLDSLIIGIICFVVMSIIKLPYSLLLSIIVGITNMIPYFGPFIGAIPGVVLFIVLDPVKAIIFAIMILALQQFDGLILGPKILGNSTGLKPLWVIFAITIGGAYYGVLGMFLGVPVVGVISYLFNKTITTRLHKKGLNNLNNK